MLEYWLVLGAVMAVGTLIIVPASMALGHLLTRKPPDLSRLFRRTALGRLAN